MNKILSNIYYNTRHPGSFSTSNKLYKAARLIDPSITKKDVTNWLKGEFTYTLHQPVRHKFPRNKIVVNAIDEQWQADLVDMQDFAAQNNGFKYILTVIDVFSKYAFAVPIKTKQAKSIVKAFTSIFEERIPLKLQTDKGKEFVNNEFQRFLKNNRVMFFTSHNDNIKCAVIERFNRTLKGKMFKYFTSKGTRKYIDVLNDLITSYNNTYHRSIRMRPSMVTSDNEAEVFRNIYKTSYRELLKERGKPHLKKGESVRRKYKRTNFDKAYYPNWTDKIFKIKNVIRKKHPLYTIQEGNKDIEGRFYKYELQPIREDLHRIEKIIDRRKRNGRIEVLVKWLNYPDSYNSWEPLKSIKNL